MKIGDKVKVKGNEAPYRGRIGIIRGINTAIRTSAGLPVKRFKVEFDDGTFDFFPAEHLEIIDE